MASLIKRLGWMILLLISCDTTERKSLQEKQHLRREAGDCDNSVYNYTNVGDPFMRTWCTSCHHSDLEQEWRAGAPLGVDLNTYELVAQYAERIDARAIGENPTMPPAGGPTQIEIDRLQVWLECGLPQ